MSSFKDEGETAVWEGDGWFGLGWIHWGVIAASIIFLINLYAPK